MTLALGLALSLLSAAALNWGWVAQHGAAAELPKLELRRPVRGLRLLFGNRAWVVGFVTGLVGWALYVVALALAPLSLVQAVSAAGIALIAGFARRRGAPLSRAHAAAVALSVLGLVLLALTLGSHTSGVKHPHVDAIAVWLACSAVVAAALVPAPLAAGAGLGAGAGVLYAAGDVATKAVVAGGLWLVLVAVVLAAHGGAFVLLQLAFQRGSALVSAGMSTLLTNALPIAAGIALFSEHLPGGVLGGVRIGAFALVVAAAALLALPGEAESAVPAVLDT
ncbi:MAG TPA: hypothetical protein VFA05_00680 [Gaiellaceae bacterium]|nr:hypothetical protein [Gaiellaceae bacterium]